VSNLVYSKVRPEVVAQLEKIYLDALRQKKQKKVGQEKENWPKNWPDPDSPEFKVTSLDLVTDFLCEMVRLERMAKSWPPEARRLLRKYGMRLAKRLARL